MTDFKNQIKTFLDSDYLNSKRLKRLISKGWKVVDVYTDQCPCGSCDPSTVVILKKKDKKITLTF